MSEEDRKFNEKGRLYVDSLYFITTTMTSVGYGDFNAFGQGDWSMSNVMLTQFAGILGFSLLKEQVFSAKHLRDINDLVKQTETDVEDTLFRIDRLRDGDDLPPDMYDEAISYMGTITRFSISESFANCEFWRQLNPPLQHRLFEAVLKDIVDRF